MIIDNFTASVKIIIFEAILIELTSTSTVTSVIAHCVLTQDEYDA